MKLWKLAAVMLLGTTAALAQTVKMPTFSEAAAKGHSLFKARCAACHGENALGSENGPPLIHFFYRPGHHNDDQIRAAVTVGVEAHHWEFGNMPPVEGISDDEKDTLVAFIRELQRANGIK